MMRRPTSEVFSRLFPGLMFGCSGQVIALGKLGLPVGFKTGNGRWALRFLAVGPLRVHLSMHTQFVSSSCFLGIQSVINRINFESNLDSLETMFLLSQSHQPVIKAALSLEAAAKKFLARQKGTNCKSLRRHVVLRASCEICVDCQSVLSRTYGTCNYPDIRDIDFTSERGNFCTTHQKYCKLEKCSYPKRISVKFNKGFLNYWTKTWSHPLIAQSLRAFWHPTHKASMWLMEAKALQSTVSCITLNVHCIVRLCRIPITGVSLHGTHFWAMNPINANYLFFGLGPVCIMYSRMGKGLRELDLGFDTHEAFYKNYASIADVLFIENVTEYPRHVIQSRLGKGWSIEDVQVDPRNLGLGMGRARSFFVAYRNDKIEWNADYSLESFLECLSSKSALTARNYFWQKLPEDHLSSAEDSCLISLAIYSKILTLNWSVLDLGSPKLAEKSFFTSVLSPSTSSFPGCGSVVEIFTQGPKTESIFLRKQTLLHIDAWTIRSSTQISASTLPMAGAEGSWQTDPWWRSQPIATKFGQRTGLPSFCFWNSSSHSL